MEKLESISLIIPVFNEERRLSVAFRAIDAFAGAPPFRVSEVVFVDDGSTDRTRALIEEFARTRPAVHCLSYSENRGKGYAVRTGMRAARGDYRLMLDVDMSTPLTELAKFAPHLARGVPVVIGTRKAVGAEVTRAQHWTRRKLGEGYTALANLITGARVSDFTCGFKCFSRDAADSIFSRARIDRWSYDAELFFLARRGGFPILEVPVVWQNDEDTRVRLGRDIAQSLVDLIRIRFHTYL